MHQFPYNKPLPTRSSSGTVAFINQRLADDKLVGYVLVNGGNPHGMIWNADGTHAMGNNYGTTWDLIPPDRKISLNAALNVVPRSYHPELKALPDV